MSESLAHAGSKNSRNALICLGLALMVFAAFWGVRHCDFLQGDDQLYLGKNPHLQRGLSWSGFQWAFSVDLLHTYPPMDYWQPMVWISRMIDVQLFGFDPGMHHLMNLLFHCLNTLLLFQVLQKMTGTAWRSFMVAALFALHPLHVESVAWVTERKDMLFGLFWMLTLWAYWKYSSGRRPPALFSTRGAWSVERGACLRWYSLTLLFFALDLMSKPMAVTLPLALLLLDYWPLRRLGSAAMKNSTTADKPRLALLEKAPFFLLSGVSALITLHSRADYVHQASPWDGIKNALVSYAAYLIKTFYPHPLAVNYPRLQETAFLPALGSALLLLGITFQAFRWARRFPFLLVGWLWFLVTLLPVMGLNDITRADRFTYVPLIGLFIALVWGIAEWQPSWKWFWTLSRGVGILALFLCAILSAIQVQFWKNDLTLYGRAIEVTEKNPIAYGIVGVVLMNEGKTDQSLKCLGRAIQLSPNDPNLWDNFGVALSDHGDFEKALRCIEQSLRLNPRGVVALNDLGSLLGDHGRNREAIEFLKKALKINPEFALAWCNLGICEARLDRREEARQHFQTALELQPDLQTAQKALQILSKK